MNALLPLELLSRTTPLESLLFLLVAGHLLGDFLFQTRWMVERKAEGLVLLAHASSVTVAHFLALVPFLSLPVAGVLLGVGAIHLAIDWVKPHWRWDQPGGLALFFLDQLAHLVVLAGAYLLLLRLGPPPIHVEMETLRIWTLVFTVGAILAVNWTGGSVVVSLVLDALSRQEAAGEPPRDRARFDSGEQEGKLERFVGLILVVLGQWTALMILVAAKSIARMEGLKERRAVGHYLVGTLTSLLVAILLGLGLRGLL